MDKLKEKLLEISDGYSLDPDDVNIRDTVFQIQLATYQLADKEWQAEYDALQSKYDLLVEDKLDAKQAGRNEVIEKIGLALFEIRSGANFCDAETVYEHIRDKLNSLK